MKVFIGSSREQLDCAIRIAKWIEQLQHEPVMWDNDDLFALGTYVLPRLIEIANTVDASVLIFGDDDQVWYRDDKMRQPRDNVLLEYGLFAGVLGHENTVICRVSKSKVPSDIDGLIRLELSESSENTARGKFLAWLRAKSPKPLDPMKTALENRVMELERHQQVQAERLAFFEQSVRDLLSKNGTRPSERTSNFEAEDKVPAGSWKLLFDYDFFWELAKLVSTALPTVDKFRAFLDQPALAHVSRRIQWEQEPNNQRLTFYVAKMQRVLRTYFQDDYSVFVDSIEPGVRSQILTLEGKALARANP